MKNKIEKSNKIFDLKSKNQLIDNEKLLNEVNNMRKEIRTLSIDNIKLKTDLYNVDRLSKKAIMRSNTHVSNIDNNTNSVSNSYNNSTNNNNIYSSNNATSSSNYNNQTGSSRSKSANNYNNTSSNLGEDYKNEFGNAYNNSNNGKYNINNKNKNINNINNDNNADPFSDIKITNDINPSYSFDTDLGTDAGEY